MSDRPASLGKRLARIVFAGAVALGVLVPATPAHAESVWYWYYSDTTSGCWNTVVTPGTPSYQCDHPGANYLPQSTISGQTVQTYIQNGAFGDVTAPASKSGDYCNSYANAYNAMPFTGYLNNDPYYYGAPTGAFAGSYCYANGSVWGTNVNETTASAGGVQHFASVQGTQVFPWSSAFGSSPKLYVYNKFGVTNNTSSKAWGYLCADLKDTGGSGQTLEICGVEWNWNKFSAPNQVMCSSAIYGAPALAGPIDYFASSGQAFTTQRSGSSDTLTTQTVPRGTVFSMEITTTNLQSAITYANSWCGAYGSWSSNLSGYRLMGIEDGLEHDLVAGDINGVEEGLLFATLY